jgi:large subunit ribosomal protein L10
MSFVYGDAPVVAKALGDLGKEFDKLSVVGGVLSGKAINAAQVKALADMPSIDVLRAQIIGAIAAPASNIVGVLNSAVGSIMYALQARIDKETPAAA